MSTNEYIDPNVYQNTSHTWTVDTTDIATGTVDWHLSAGDIDTDTVISLGISMPNYISTTTTSTANQTTLWSTMSTITDFPASGYSVMKDEPDTTSCITVEIEL